MSDNCPSCGAKWSKHPGVQTVCRKYTTAKRAGDQWRNRALASEAVSDLYLKGMKRLAAAWKAHHDLPQYEPGIEELISWMLENVNTIKRLCPHDRRVGECHICDLQADMAFDSAREARAFGR